VRVGISNIAWDPSRDADVAVILRSHGLDAIDIAPGKYVSVADASAAELAALRRVWESRGFEITGMQSLLYGTTGLTLFEDASSRQAMLEFLAHVCRVGGALGATRLVFGSPKNRDIGSLHASEAEAIAVSFFRQLGDIAERRGVRIMLEPNPRVYGATYMVDSAETAAVVAAVDHPGIAMQLDLGAMALNDEDVSIMADLQGLVGHVHVSMPHLAPVAPTEFLADAGPEANRLWPNHIACIEMLTKEDPLAEIEDATRYAVATFGGGSSSP